jgi:hypothetical protein
MAGIRVGELMGLTTFTPIDKHPVISRPLVRPIFATKPIAGLARLNQGVVSENTCNSRFSPHAASR